MKQTNGGMGSAPTSPASDVTGQVDFVDLGETPIKESLDVDPRSVGGGSGRRRIDPKVILLVAATILGVGLLGTGPRPPGPATSASPGPLVSPTTAAASLDPCPEAGLPAPILRLGPRGVSGDRIEVGEIRTSLSHVGFAGARQEPLTTTPGTRLHLTLGDSRCLEAWRLDLHRTDAPAEEILPVTDLTEMEAGHKLAFSAPPAGRWVVRVILRLRGPTFEDTPWAVYWIGLDTGLGGPGGPVEPQVTPAVACGPLDSGAELPPAVDLVLGDGTTVRGALGDYTWAGRTVTSGAPDLSGGPPVDLPLGTPVALHIAGQVCAVRWSIEGGPAPARGGSMEIAWSWDGYDDGVGNLAIAAQNVFSVSGRGLGDYLIRGTFGLGGGGAETVYWRAHTAVPSAPEAWVAAEPGGTRVLSVVGCGISVRESDFGMVASEWCSAGDPPGTPADMPTLQVATGGLLRAEIPGLRITQWDAIVISGDGSGLVGGWSEIGLPSVEIPLPPPGVWTVRISLTVRVAGYATTVPYYVRLEVLG